MKFLSNTLDPNAPNFKMNFPYSFEAFRDLKKRELEFQDHMNWINRNIIGPPQATDYYSVEELQKMNMVGIYKKDEDESKL